MIITSLLTTATYVGDEVRFSSDVCKKIGAMAVATVEEEKVIIIYY